MSVEFLNQQLPQWRGAASLGWLVLLLTWESLAPYFKEFSSLKERGLHAWRNLLVGWANGLMTFLVFALIWKRVAGWSAEQSLGLLHRLSLSPVWHLALAVVILDLWTYWWHRWAHEIPFLWRFHRMHHSDPQMDVTTANRFHPGEIILSSLLRIPVIALAGVEFWHLVVYETLLQISVQLQHANITVGTSLDRALRLVFVSPQMHKVHHSTWQPETDSNYASLFSIWDRVFGSFRMRPDPEHIQFGLETYQDPSHQTFRGMLRTPLNIPDTGSAVPRDKPIVGSD